MTAAYRMLIQAHGDGTACLLLQHIVLSGAQLHILCVNWSACLQDTSHICFTEFAVHWPTATAKHLMRLAAGALLAIRRRLPDSWQCCPAWKGR